MGGNHTTTHSCSGGASFWVATAPFPTGYRFSSSFRWCHILGGNCPPLQTAGGVQLFRWRHVLGGNCPYGNGSVSAVSSGGATFWVASLIIDIH